MLHPSTQKLIDRLAAMTARQELAWQESDNGNPEYSTEGYRVVLLSEPTELRILSEAGKEVERASAEQLLATKAGTGGSYADIVQEMHVEALRKARGTETAISTLLSRLEQDAGGTDQSHDAPADEEALPPATDTAPEVLAAEPGPESAETDETSVALDAAIEDAPEPDADESDRDDGELSEDEASMTAAVARLANEVRERSNWVVKDETPTASADHEDAVAIPAEMGTDAHDETGHNGLAELGALASPTADAVSAEADEDGTADEAVQAGLDVTGFAYVPFGLMPVSGGDLPTHVDALAGEDALASPAGDLEEDETETPFLSTAAEPEPEVAAFSAGSLQDDLSTESPHAEYPGTETIPPAATAAEYQFANDDEPLDSAPEDAEPQDQPETHASPTIGLSGLGAGYYQRDPAPMPGPESAPDIDEADDEEEGIVETQERIVIDATDDYLDYVPADPPEPEETPDESRSEELVTVSVEAVEETGTAAENDDKEGPVQRERPRFNPWS